MPTKKLDDTENANLSSTCRSTNHYANFTEHRADGAYEHTCSECGFRYRFRVNGRQDRMG